MTKKEKCLTTSIHVNPWWSCLNYALSVPLGANATDPHKFSVMLEGEGCRKRSVFCYSSSPCCSPHSAEVLEWGFPSSVLRHASLSVFLAGFYPVNHTDCLQSYLHHCFDGITGELAHAFFPSTGEIHFDDHEYWILGNMRFSWKKGKCLYHVCWGRWYVNQKVMVAVDPEHVGWGGGAATQRQTNQ